MKRVVGYAVGLVVLLAVLLAPAAFWNTASDGPAETGIEISSYAAVFDVAADGDLTVHETLRVDFLATGKHGIFRFWDHADDSAPTARRLPHDITVSMDGQPVDRELLEEDHGRITVAKVGSPDVTVTPGEHVYEIAYTIDGVIEPGTTGERSQFYWNLVPDGPVIDKTDLTVHLPVAASAVRCAVGTGSTSGCTAQGDGTRTLHVRTGRLAAHTPVTIKTGLDMPTPEAGDTRPWSTRFDRVLGPSPWLLALVLLLAVAAGVLGGIAAFRAREEQPGFPLQYAPPEGIGPAQAAYVLRERVNEETYVATLMYAAEKGAVDLSKNGEAWSITDRNGPGGWTGLDPVTSQVAHLLGGPGMTFTATPKDVSAGERLKEEIASFESNTAAWAKDSGAMVTSGLGSIGPAVVLAALAATAAVVIWNPFSMTAVGLVPGVFAVLAAPLVLPGSGTRRTRAGRDLWSRIGGFHRVLSTDSSKDRFDFSGREELYTAYVPWAVAFGCADAWARKYRTETGAEPPVPSYLAGAYVGAGIGHVSSMVDDFSATVGSAISSYQATQSSSSGGGGGFSGGGGGGGGGVGSW